MDSAYRKLLTYSYNILGSLEVRVNKTFQHKDGRYLGLVKNKRCNIITTMGGIRAGTIQEEGFENYIRNILEFIGIYDCIVFCIDGTTDPEYVTGVLTETKSKITSSLSIL